MDVKELIAKMEEAKTTASGIIAEHKGQPIPAEKKAELDRALEEAKDYKGQIEEHNELEAKSRDIASMDDFLNKPQYRVPRGTGNGADDTKGALLSAGWEVKNGIVFAPTSLGHSVPMWTEDVLFGDLPTDPNSQKFFKATRASMQPEYRDAYVKWLRTAVKHRSEAMAYSSLAPAEQKALSEGSDEHGGFLVPPDAQAEMLVRTATRSVMRRLAQVVTTSRDKVTYPRVQAHPTDGSIYSSGFVGGWVGETPLFTDTDPKFGSFEIGIKKIRVGTKLSNDFISDSAVNILSFLSMNGAENIALVEDKGFIAGLGTALEPLGISNSPGAGTLVGSGGMAVDVEGSTSNTISNTNSSAGSAPKLLDLIYALPSQYAANAVLIMRRAIEGKIRKLVDGQDRFLWPALAGEAFGRTSRSIEGHPVESSEFVANDGADGAKVIVFGDMRNYIVATRAQISTVILRERFADTDETGIVLFERAGGALWNPDAVRIGVV